MVGVDWRVPLPEAARRIGPSAVVQGNLDPALLLAEWPVVDAEVRRIVTEGRYAGGHIFNLGHGVLPETDPDVLTRVVALVKELTRLTWMSWSSAEALRDWPRPGRSAIVAPAGRCNRARSDAAGRWQASRRLGRPASPWTSVPKPC